MDFTKQTILITGGSSGIGLELTRQLSEAGNTVIICGRSQLKLDQAKEKITGVITFLCDVSKEEDRKRLMHFITTQYSECSVLINNAAIVNKTNFFQEANMLEKAAEEININLMAPIALCSHFYPLFIRHRDAMIINITTGLIYSPRAVYPIYNSTKAGLHAFTQVIRKQLEGTNIKVVEVMMPVVDTPWHNGAAPKIAISAESAVNEMLAQLRKEKREIRVGSVKLLYFLARLAPALAFRLINNVK